MKEILLTNREKVILENVLTKYKSNNRKRLNQYLISIIVGVVIAGIVAYYNFGDRNGRLYIGILIITSIMLLPIFFYYLKTKTRINKLKSDINDGKKFEGKGIIKSINKFNRMIYLDNGIKGYESIENNREFKKGDLIKFKTSMSNEYIFEFKKK